MNINTLSIKNQDMNMRRCHIEVQFESGKTSFFKNQKKAISMNKISHRWYCWVYGTRILQKKLPPLRACTHAILCVHGPITPKQLV